MEMGASHLLLRVLGPHNLRSDAISLLTNPGIYNPAFVALEGWLAQAGAALIGRIETNPYWPTAVFLVGGDVGRTRLCGASSPREDRRRGRQRAPRSCGGNPAMRAIGAVAENVIRPLAQREVVHERQAKVTNPAPSLLV
jgi:hypothetical protein